MRVLIIDNYDSFTYNLYQYCGEILEISNIDVIRNDQITIKEIKKRNYDRIIISPGPGDPSDKAYFGVCTEILLDVGKKIPVLGVCLGMQGMAYCFGGKVVPAKVPMHGKTSIIRHNAKGLFKNLPQNVEVMRYHSLIADSKTLPECLEITAIVGHPGGRESTDRILLENKRDSIASLRLLQNDSIEIMGLRHKKYPIFGIQFHPESFATDGGKILLTNFLFGNVHHDSSEVSEI